MSGHVRCINIDWLEVYALEPLTSPIHDATFFRSHGWQVDERPYGTPIYLEMFKLVGTDGLPLLEVRRNPKCAQNNNETAILPINACHIRLCNRTCYRDDAAQIMEEFLQRYEYTLQRISRLDVCLDFEKFDRGDDPQKFLQRYIAGKFAKINQANISVHGLDRWDGRYWNSVKWGSQKSMVTTKFYDKTKELQEESDKPYIRQAWYLCKLVDDWRTLEKYGADGVPYKPKIWRVEFSIKSHEKNWFVIENPYNTKPKLRSIKHTLAMYHTRIQLCDVFFSLAEHYFHFKHVEYIDGKSDSHDRQLQRKDRCRDKVLFDTTEKNVTYKVAAVNTSAKKTVLWERLLRYLCKYQVTVTSPRLNKAINEVRESIELKMHTEDVVSHLDEDTIRILQLLIAQRMKNRQSDVSDELATLQNMFRQQEDKMF